MSLPHRLAQADERPRGRLDSKMDSGRRALLPPPPDIAKRRASSMRDETATHDRVHTAKPRYIGVMTALLNTCTYKNTRKMEVPPEHLRPGPRTPGLEGALSPATGGGPPDGPANPHARSRLVMSNTLRAARLSSFHEASRTGKQNLPRARTSRRSSSPSARCLISRTKVAELVGGATVKNGVTVNDFSA